MSEVAASTEFGYPNSLVRGEAPNTPLDSRDSSIHSPVAFESVRNHPFTLSSNTVKFDSVTSLIVGGLEAQPSTSEFGRPNSVLAAPLHGAIKHLPGTIGRAARVKSVSSRGADKAFFDPCGQANNRYSFDGNRLMQLRALSEYRAFPVRNRYTSAVCNSDARITAPVINPYLHACYVFVRRPQALTSG